MMLAAAIILFVRARIMNRKSIERDGLSRFRDAFHGRFPETLLDATYHCLAERHGNVGPHYIVRPDDDLERVFGLADLDLEDAVLVIADRASARLPNSRDLDQLKTSHVKSVEDMLVYLEPYFKPEVANR